MNTLAEIAANPSGFDSARNYIGTPFSEFENLYVVMTRSRDSSLLTECNWSEAIALLGGESESVVIHRFGHWSCGWWEALCVTKDKEQEGQEIVDSLENYPILNDEKFSEMEWEGAEKTWREMSIKDRVELCQKADVSIFSARHEWIPRADDRGYIFERCRPE